MDELLNEYCERFGDNFPIFTFQGSTDDELMAIIKKCLDSGKPFVEKDFSEIY